VPTPSIASLGQTRGGIRSEADVLARCEVLSATGCWIWLGACSTGKAGARATAEALNDVPRHRQEATRRAVNCR
jgi:hypothetical protein